MAKHKVEITGIKTNNIKVLKNDETVKLIEEYKNTNNNLILEKTIMGNMKLLW